MSESYELIYTNKSEDGLYITGNVSKYFDELGYYTQVGKFILELKRFPNFNTTEYDGIYITKYEFTIIFDKNIMCCSNNFRHGFTLKGTYESKHSTKLSDFNMPFQEFKNNFIENNSKIADIQLFIKQKLPSRTVSNDIDKCQIKIEFILE